MDPDCEHRSESDGGLRRVAVAVASAVATFCLVSIAVYYKMADVSVNGWAHGGPATLAAGMAGLFSGGLAALVVLILLLRRR
jgi:hypothetical protein